MDFLVVRRHIITQRYHIGPNNWSISQNQSASRQRQCVVCRRESQSPFSASLLFPLLCSLLSVMEPISSPLPLATPIYEQSITKHTNRAMLINSSNATDINPNSLNPGLLKIRNCIQRMSDPIVIFFRRNLYWWTVNPKIALNWSTSATKAEPSDGEKKKQKAVGLDQWKMVKTGFFWNFPVPASHVWEQRK